MILSFPPATDFQELNSIYGVMLPLATLDPTEGTAKTIIGGQDVQGSTALRAGIIGQTAMPITLSDGRLALSGTFAQPLLDAMATNSSLAQELTQDQLTTLTPKPQL